MLNVSLTLKGEESLMEKDQEGTDTSRCAVSTVW